MTDRLDLPPGLVGVPCVAWMWTASVQCFMALDLPAGSRMLLDPGGGSVATKRERLVDALLARPELEWLLFLDSDMTCAPDIARRLLEVDADVAAAVMTTRKEDDMWVVAGHFTGPLPDDLDPLRPTDREDFPARVVNPLEIDPNGPPFEVDLVGTGATLIRRHVLEAMERPAFVGNLRYALDSNEDHNFSVRARRAGFTLKVHPGVQVGHLGARAYGLEDAQRAALQVSGGLDLDGALAHVARTLAAAGGTG